MSENLANKLTVMLLGNKTTPLVVQQTENVVVAQSAKRGRGRPKGSKNKPKGE